MKKGSGRPSHFNIYFNITLPSLPRSSKWSLCFRISLQDPVCICSLRHTCYMFLPSYPPWFGHPEYLMSTHKDPHCPVFSGPLLLRLTHIYFTRPCHRTSSVSVHVSMAGNVSRLSKAGEVTIPHEYIL